MDFVIVLCACVRAVACNNNGDDDDDEEEEVDAVKALTGDPKKQTIRHRRVTATAMILFGIIILWTIARARETESFHC